MESYYSKNKERLKAYQKSYFLKNKERILKYNREWREKNKSWFKKWGLNYRSKNRSLIKERNRKLWKKRKQLAVDYLGGECSRCGYKKDNRALEFHHYKGKKSFSISSAKKRKSWSEIKLELEKCILLCANCHREIS